MRRELRLLLAVLGTLGGMQVNAARGQWVYPGGFGGAGWGGWGGTTVGGDMARGLGEFAAGVGFYNKQSAIADAIDADTAMRWNEYMYQSQMEANRRRQRRIAEANAQNNALRDSIQKRLRDNPTPGDVSRGDALNVALDEIDDPRVYLKALQGAKVKIDGAVVRLIPFRYAAAAVTLSVHQLATGELPAPLRSPEFAADREALKTLDAKLLRQIDEDNDPDPATVQELLAVIHSMEEKSARMFAAGGIEQKQSERYLKAMHGLIVMLKRPKIEQFLAGVESRPEVPLGELLSFMTAFNLRFGIASTPEQRRVYNSLYPQLVELRDQVAPLVAAGTPAAKPNGEAPFDFYSAMSFDDLRKAAPGDKP